MNHLPSNVPPTGWLIRMLDNVLLPNFTQLLKRTHDIYQSTNSTNPFVTLPQLVPRFRKWKESTSTSPSRRHLGHYKSLLPPFVYNINEYAASPHGEIMNVHVILLNFCAATGYLLKRWHKIVTTMIPKENNNFKLH